MGTFDVFEVDDLERFAPPDHDNLLVVRVDDLLGVLDDWRRIGGDEKLPLSYSYYQRAAFPGRNDLIRIPLFDHGDGVGSDHFAQGLLYGCTQVAIVGLLEVADQLYQHFGVGFASEGDSMILQIFFQHGVILDDSVVDQSQ